MTTLTSLVSFSDVVKKNGLQPWVPYLGVPLLVVFPQLYVPRVRSAPACGRVCFCGGLLHASTG